MRFLICGLGSIGRRHLRNLQALGQEDILLYRTGKSSLPDDDLAGLKVFNDLQAALDREPQAVIVSNPTALHLPVAQAAAAAGCHLLLEKPVSDRSQGLDRLAKSVEDNHLRVLVGFQFRFHPGLMRLHELLQEGVLGEVFSARAHWGEYLPDWHPWEDYRQSYSARPELGGGVVLTLCHPLDYLGWFFGEAQSLSAMVASSATLNLQVEDLAEINLAFRDGPIANLHLNYLQRPARHAIEVIGEHGTLRWEQADGVLQHYDAGKQAWRRFAPPAGFERNDLFMDEMRHFLEMLEQGVESRCTLQDGIRALNWALAAKQ
ncbi:MAG TPA: Gfo/Idh/MocA family oxidoreductase, partial [Anaerolineales bacterium]